MSFKEIGVCPEILKSIKEMGFKEPTTVQDKAIPHILNNKDLIVMAKTGSGKTGAFGIPVLQSIDSKSKLPQALILTPTRELAVQVNEDLKVMSKYLKIQTTAVYGQHNINVEMDQFEKGVALVSGTPGRVFDHIQKRSFITKEIKFLVLDEADRMLDMGFIDQVVKIIKSLPKNRVTLLFSATMPDEIQNICKEYMNDPETIKIDSDTMTVDSILQSYYRVEANEKRTQLDNILKVEQPDSCMVFCNTRYEVDKVHNFLTRKGYMSQSLHGANTQTSRMRTIEKFKKGKVQILVATDVAARGIHIDDLSLVINYDVPLQNDGYVHRIGRTGRAGNGGKAITIVTSDDIISLYGIEEHVGVLISEEELPTEEYVRECVEKASGKWVGIKPEPQRRSSNHHKDSQVKRRSSKNTHSKSHSKLHSEHSHKSNSTSNKSNDRSNKRKNNYKGKSYDPNYKKSTHKPRTPYVPVSKRLPVESVQKKKMENVVNQNNKKSLFKRITGFFKKNK